MTPEEGVERVRAFQAGEEGAQERLFAAYESLVTNVTKTYRPTNLPFEDLIVAGRLGLLEAAKRFDSEKGYRFSTYATHWIRHAIGRAGHDR